MFNKVDTAFSYEIELIVCSFLQDFSMGMGSSLQSICNAHTAFFTLFTDWFLQEKNLIIFRRNYLYLFIECKYQLVKEHRKLPTLPVSVTGN